MILAALDWVGGPRPSPEEIANAPVLEVNHHSWAPHPELLNVHHLVPQSWKKVGHRAPDPTLTCSSYGWPDSITIQIDMQWRWNHERAKVLREDAARNRAEQRKRDRARAKERARRWRLTLRQLRREPVLPRDVYPFSLPELTAARKVVREALDALLELGQRKAPQERRAILERCAQRLARIDAATGIFRKLGTPFFRQALDEMAHAAGTRVPPGALEPLEH
jgi:hypothetical protein